MATMELLIKYKDAEGKITDRRISEIEPYEPGYILAFCHERRENRTFKVSRIVAAVHPETGEVAEDVYALFGMESPDPPPPKPVPVPVGTKEVKAFRNVEKRELFGRFGLAVVEEHAKGKFFSFFGDRCFKCDSPGPLVMDHHVPITLGGHLVPGNLVALCRPCNNGKRDAPPEAFYSPSELDRLAPFLEGQHALFNFSFDRNAWKADRGGYLLSLGIDPALVAEVLGNPEHRFYVPSPDERPAVTITVTIDEETVKRIVREALGG